MLRTLIAECRVLNTRRRGFNALAVIARDFCWRQRSVCGAVVE